MVGRDQELAGLLEVSDAVRAGLGRAVLVTGEPGMGKTRLISEWKNALEQARSDLLFHWVRGRTFSFDQTIPYHLLNNLLYVLLGLSPSAGSEQALEELQKQTAALFGADAVEVYPYLGHMLSLNLPEPAQALVRQLDPEALQSRYLNALRQYLAALAGQRPQVLILEDIHWADPSSVELITRLLPLVFTSPLLLCMVTRPERATAGWRLAATARETLASSLVEFNLLPLPESDSRQLVNNLLAIDELSESVRATILATAEGNPFFVEEIIRTLIDRGVIVQQNGGWRAQSEINAVDIPDNLQGLLLASIDRLPVQARGTLRVASVIGRRFPLRLLENILGSADLMSQILALETAGLVRIAQVKPEVAYHFRHALLHETAYASLLPDDRRRLHLQVGEAVEEVYPGRVDEFASALACHFYEAGDRQRALKYFLAAGKVALETYANVEAESYFRSALKLLPSTAQQAELLSSLGETLFGQNRYPEAIETWRQGVATFSLLGDRDNMARLYARAARASWHAGDVPNNLQNCLEGLRAVGSGLDTIGMAALIHETARAYYFNGEPRQALPLCRQALAMAERLGALEVQADALATLGILPGQPPEEALAALEKAVVLTESAGMLGIGTRAHTNLGAMKMNLLGDLPSAYRHFQRATELHARRGALAEAFLSRLNVLTTGAAMGEVADLERTLEEMEATIPGLPEPERLRSILNLERAALISSKGDWENAIPLLRSQFAEARKRGDLQTIAGVGRSLGWSILDMAVCTGQGDLAEAAGALGESLRISELGLSSVVSTHCLLGMLSIARGDVDEGQRCLERARQKAGENAIPLERAWVDWLEAAMLNATGAQDAAIRRYQEAAALMQTASLIWHQARILVDQAEARIQRANPADLETAMELLSSAQALFTRRGATHYAERVAERQRRLETETRAQAHAHQLITKELAQAGRIQEGFLPVDLPHLPGWQIAASLKPARQTSGDFYDFIPLADGTIGILVADVADKGMGAALIMALSSALLRTFAVAHRGEPQAVFHAANQRMLRDSQTGVFVTMFYAILDPLRGALRYCNAGHVPPVLLRHGAGLPVQLLTHTGVPLGVLPEVSWEQSLIQMQPGDVLLLYTDGLTEAQSPSGEYFGDSLLEQSLRRHAADNGPQRAWQVLNGLLKDLEAFLGKAPSADDVALLVVVRD
jgi:serine phosphatase RsbU (regulator of sigma subunit)